MSYLNRLSCALLLMPSLAWAQYPSPTFQNLTVRGTLSVPGGIAVDLSSPGPVGSVAPNSGAFTSLSASGAVAGAGFTARLASPGPIGNIAPSTGAFTTFSASGNATIGGTLGVSGAFTAPVSLSTIIATGGSTARTLADRAVDAANFNVMDYGAFCDGNTDDTAAINAATAAARANQTAPGGLQAAKILFPPGKSCVATGPLNFTGFTSDTRTVYVEGQGASIWCKQTGAACVDVLGSKFMRFDGLQIYGDLSSTPKVGLQLGRISSASADQFKFHNVSFTGNFTLAALYNLASETNKFDGLVINNGQGSGTCFGLVQDGANHWNITSTFVTETIPQDTQGSFNENDFIQPIIQTTHCVPIWLEDTARHSFRGGYVSTSAAQPVMLYDGSKGSNDQLLMDVHFEPNTITNTFLLTGSKASPTLVGFEYRNSLEEASGSVFKLDSGVTSAALLRSKIEVASYSPVPTLPMFDNAANYTFTGTVRVPAAANWNTPATFDGMTFIGSAMTLTGILKGTTGSSVGPNTVSGTDGFSVGQSNTASGTCLSAGLSNLCSNSGSVALGWNATDRGSNAMAYSSFSGNVRWMTMTAVTTNATPTRIVLGGGGSPNAANTINIPSNTAFLTRITVIARRSDSAGNYASWVSDGGMLTSEGGVGSVVYTGSATPILQTKGTTTGWALAIAADTTNGGISLTATGAAAQTINWTAFVETTEVQ